MKRLYKFFGGFIILLSGITTMNAQVTHIYISEIMYDSPLAEDKFISPGEHNNAEYIKLFNPTNKSVDISKWVLTGAETWEHVVFPAGTLIQPQSSILISYYKSNTNFSFFTYYHIANSNIIKQSAIILYNNGETLRLYDSSVNLVDVISYTGNKTSSGTPVLFAKNGVGTAYNQLKSLHRKQVSTLDGKAITLGNTDLTYGLATPLSGGNAFANNTTSSTVNPPQNLNLPLGQNYIVTTVPLVPKTTASFGAIDELASIQYFDGLGRPVQTVQQRITPKGMDLVTYLEYDNVGREYRQWLPILSTGNGAYIDPVTFKSNQTSLYDGDARPYVETLYEKSPLNRVEGQFNAGNIWFVNNKKTRLNYQTNGNDVASFYVNSNNLLQRGPDYGAGMLYKTESMDEDGKTSIEYKDKLGRVIMKQIGTASYEVKTYYVFNDLGQLSYVIPPEAVDRFTVDLSDENTIMKQYCYLYKYDERGNNIEKRLPGCDPIYMVYDKADLLILSQDGNQRAKKVKQWTVTKYDALGRVVLSGIMNSDSTRVQFKEKYSNKVVTESYKTGTGYSKAYFSLATPLKINYYDDYNFTGLLTNGSSLLYVDAPTGFSKQYLDNTGKPNVVGLLTGTCTYILDEAISQYLSTVVYYDDRGQVVQSRSTNHLGGNDIVYNQYDFTGKVMKTVKVHNIANQGSINEVYRNEYDHAGRLVKTIYKLNTKDSIILVKQNYDELGRLTYNYRHNSTDTVSYNYNIRNWVTGIKSGGFKEELFYNDLRTNYATPCYNGNIAYSTWTYDKVKKAYTYVYDNLNRLTNSFACLTSGNALYAPNSQEHFYYDKQGNITYLWRQKGNINIDYLSITYDGNQLKSVFDYYGSKNQYDLKEYNNRATRTIEFKYDKNGSMIKDLDRNIVTIRYNVLNLPDTIQFVNGNQIINRYTADGRKLSTDYFSKVTPIILPLDADTVCKWTYQSNVINQSTSIYIDNKEYQVAGGLSYYKKLMRVYNAEGYVDNFDAFPPSENYNYYRRDHLGNNREVWRASYIGATTGNVIPAATIQRTQYYPSGLPWSEGTGASMQPYKYNGKEFIEMHGYDTYDYGARGYYAAIGRFSTVDPLAEKIPWISPYVYCSDNPVNKIDPDGKREWPVNRTYKGNGRRHENNWHAPRPHGRFHKGLDLNHTGGGNTDKGAPIIATHNGTITRVGHAGDGDAGGNRIKITSADGTVSTSYMHLDAASSGLKVGSKIKEGQQIGTMGRSGAHGQSDYTAHLHYEVSVDRTKINAANGSEHLVDPQKIIDSKAPTQQPERIYDGGTLPEIPVIGHSPEVTQSTLPQIPVTEIRTLEIKPFQY